MFFIKSKVKFNWFPTFESNKKWQKYPLRTPYYFFFLYMRQMKIDY